jgi:hypothetical protein
MKINSIEVDTDLGRRTVQLSPTIDVDPTGDMPTHFLQAFTELLWNLMQQFARESSTFSAPKVEA